MTVNDIIAKLKTIPKKERNKEAFILVSPRDERTMEWDILTKYSVDWQGFWKSLLIIITEKGEK